MRKLIYSLLAILLVGIIVIYIKEAQREEIDVSTIRVVEYDANQISQQDVESIEKAKQVFEGYFYFDNIDIREPLDESEEEEYYYYMDKYFQTYYKELTKSVFDKSEAEEMEDDYEDYFQDLGLNILPISNKAKTRNLRNGDYISVEIEGPILESFPPQAKVINVERIEPRTIYKFY